MGADLFEESKVMKDTFWIMYFICEGCGINKMDQGLYSAQFKELCCRGYTNIESPIVDGVLCGTVATEFCIWSECSMPPAKGDPMLACCTRIIPNRRRLRWHEGLFPYQPRLSSNSIPLLK